MDLERVTVGWLKSEGFQRLLEVWHKGNAPNRTKVRDLDWWHPVCMSAFIGEVILILRIREGLD
ncbi:MAG: hypothetical protein ISS36_00345 [Candidatus Aenigmarchaeota archaeon]|nr:hypothetical protein [Candidatus Aenigmarchaeota archaeon]